jgi:hypothetical protein
MSKEQRSCKTCQYHDTEISPDGPVRVCRFGPPTVVPLIGANKRGQPQELGRWVGRPWLKDEEWCYQWKIDLAHAMGLKQ